MSGESTQRTTARGTDVTARIGAPVGLPAQEPETLRGFLAAAQARMGLDDSAFAALLGMDVATWREITAGGQGWPSAALARVLLRFPDAHPLAAEEVRRRVAPGDGWRWWHAA